MSFRPTQSGSDPVPHAPTRSFHQKGESYESHMFNTSRHQQTNQCAVLEHGRVLGEGFELRFPKQFGLVLEAV